MGRKLVAAILGGLVVFMWGYVSHMFLPFHQDAVKTFSHSPSEFADFFGELSESGVYSFPMVDSDGKLSEAQKAIWEKGPRVTMAVVRKDGGSEAMTKQLLMSFAWSIAAALVAAIVLGSVGGGFGRKVFVATLIGGFAALATHVQFWVWFEYSNKFLVAYVIDSVVAWFFAGIVMAKVLGGGKPA